MILSMVYTPLMKQPFKGFINPALTIICVSLIFIDDLTILTIFIDDLFPISYL